MQESIQTSLPLKISFFLFINTKSGGQLGQKYLTLSDRAISYEFKKTTIVSVRLIDLFDKSSVSQGLKKLTDLTSNQRKSKYKNDVRVIVCGGDGSVLWVVSLVSKYGINTNKVIFGIIPIGTGNDFSRSCGWGGTPINFSHGNARQLKALIVEWIRADQSEYDIWDFSLTTYDNGTIINIRDKQEVDLKQKTLSREFCNYFGLGIDARICYSVQKHRQSNKFANLMLYGCIGVCKLFQKIKNIDKVVQNFSQGDNVYNQDDYQDAQDGQQTEKNVSNAIKHKLLDEVKQDPSKIIFKEGYCSLLCLNSTRYMAGLKNVWATRKVGVVEKGATEFVQQRVDDGMIEFLAFKSELRLGLERIINSGARIAQGRGPFIIKIKKEEGNYPTYIHIDGEAMKIYHPKEIIIKKSQTVPNGKIKVMIKRKY